MTSSIDPSQPPAFAVILPAGGTSSRFGSDKLLAELNGQPVIVRSVRAMLAAPLVKQVIVGGGSTYASLLSGMDVTFADAGSCRAETVRNALSLVNSDCTFVAIHDAARPGVSPELIERVFTAAVRYSAAGPALPLKDTIKSFRVISGEKMVSSTLDRTALRAMQTPQAMRTDALVRGFRQCPVPLEQVTDDLQLIEFLGEQVVLVGGEEANLKITTPFDLKVMQLLMNGEG